MSTMSQRAASFPTAPEITTVVADSASSVAKRSHGDQPFRLSLCIIGLLLAVSFVLFVEVSVYALTGAAMDFVSHVYHETLLPRHYADEAVSSADDDAETAPGIAGTSSAHDGVRPATKEAPDAISKAGIRCILGPHNCD